MDKKSVGIMLSFIVVLAIGIALLSPTKDVEKQRELKMEPESQIQTETQMVFPISVPSKTIPAETPQSEKESMSVVMPQQKTVPLVRIDPIINTPPSLVVVMGEGQDKNYFTRIKDVHNLGKNLSGEEIQTLFALLNRKDGVDSLTPDKLNALKNDVVNALMEQEVMPLFLANNLMAMYYDKGHDHVWRDYCIQHLGGIYGKVDEKQAISVTIWDGTKETELGIAGTALIALANNADGTYIKKEDVAAKALELSTSSNCGELAKITALQICAKLGEKQVLPTARSIAQSGGSVPLRMSAIAAVGTLGGESDREMLDKYAASSDVRLRKSAQSALQRLGK